MAACHLLQRTASMQSAGGLWGQVDSARGRGPLQQGWGHGALRRQSLRVSKAGQAGAKAPATHRCTFGALTVRATLGSIREVDKQKFDGMKYRRTVFDFPDWTKHKSSSRFSRNVTTILTSRNLRSLWPPVQFMTLVAIAVVVFNELVKQGLFPDWVHLIHMNPLPISLTAPALSFLLVFRTNSSYGRFDEARKMWGLMLNRTRDVTRQTLSYIGRPGFEKDRPAQSQFLRHLQAFSLAYKHHFLQEGDLEIELKTETPLTPAEIEGILSAKHRPNYILQVMSQCLSSCTIEPTVRLAIDQNLTTFADDIGGCERLFKTPIPLSYTRLTSRFLVLWNVFLPIALYDACGWITIPATFFTTFALFCVEEVGVLIEEPFSILALDAIARTARTNVQELINLHGGIRTLVADNKVLADRHVVRLQEPAVTK